ncbi:MAG: hypothetical protein ACE5JN_15715 [Candidatus Methylomirabilia bacterium]
MYETRIRSYGVALPAEKRPFSWQRLTDRAQYHDMMREASFENIEVQTEQLGYYLHTVDEWWDIVWNSGFCGPVS